MKFQTLQSSTPSRDYITTFGGYNHTHKAGAADFYDEKNMTSDYYPLISSRDKRVPAIYNPSLKAQAMIAVGDNLFWVDKPLNQSKTYLIKNGTSVMELSGTGEKQLVAMGAYICVFPDGKYYNTVDSTDKGDMAASYVSEHGYGTTKVTYTMCDKDGTAYTPLTKSDIKPENPANGDYWLDGTNRKSNALYRWSASQEQWVAVLTSYIKISAEGIAEKFKQYDGVYISQVSPTSPQMAMYQALIEDLNNKYHVIMSLNHDAATPTNDWIVVQGITADGAQQYLPLKVERKVPKMDFVCEWNNRIWGCYYGLGDDGKQLNEIYACKQGDCTNWFCYENVATDSYTASVGSAGPFTGAVNYNGYPHFFKEYCYHKVYGNYPSNYQVYSNDCDGVQIGCSKTIVEINNELYYKGREGVFRFTGSDASCISSALGNIRYTGSESTTTAGTAAAGEINNKYYISMCSEKDSKYYLFCYDVSNAIWHKEDNTKVKFFCKYKETLLMAVSYNVSAGTLPATSPLDYRQFILAVSDKYGSLDDMGELGIIPEEGIIEWSTESGIIGTSSPDKKYVSRLDFRMKLSIGARVMIYIQYDSTGDWKHIASLTGNTIKTFSLPVRIRRCDHFRIKLVGKGDVKIFSIAKTIETGSAL